MGSGRSHCCRLARASLSLSQCAVACDDADGGYRFGVGADHAVLAVAADCDRRYLEPFQRRRQRVPAAGARRAFECVTHRDRTAVFARYSLVGSLLAAVGSLAAALPAMYSTALDISMKASLQLMFVFYAALGLLAALVYRGLPASLETETRELSAPLDKSRRRVYWLAGLFSLDAFGGGFVVQSMIALWLYQRFGLSLASAGTVFFWTGVLTALSYLVAVRIAKRIGLINTMVFTHLPSSLCLIAIPFMPELGYVIALLFVRSALSQMDVPTRSSYVMAIVEPAERPAAAGVTSVPRTLAAAASPLLAGYMLALSSFGWPPHRRRRNEDRVRLAAADDVSKGAAALKKSRAVSDQPWATCASALACVIASKTASGQPGPIRRRLPFEARYPAAIASVRASPARPCAHAAPVDRTPRRAAASTTMMLAMLPTMNRLPASVLTSASSRAGQRMRAHRQQQHHGGHVGTMFDSTKVAANSGAGCCRSNAAAARSRSPAGQAGLLQGVVDDEQPHEQHQQLPVDQPQHACASAACGSCSSTPAPVSATTSRGQGANRKQTARRRPRRDPWRSASGRALASSGARLGMRLRSRPSVPAAARCHAIKPQVATSPSSTGSAASAK